MITGHRWDGHRSVRSLYCFQNSWISRSVFCICLLYLSFVFVFCICLLYLYFEFAFVSISTIYSQELRLSRQLPPALAMDTVLQRGPYIFPCSCRYKCFRTFLSYISILQRSLLSFEMFKNIYFFLTTTITPPPQGLFGNWSLCGLPGRPLHLCHDCLHHDQTETGDKRV